VVVLSTHYETIGSAIAQWSASQLEGWVFDPRPLSESPQRSTGKSVHVSRLGKNHISGFGLPPTVVTKNQIKKDDEQVSTWTCRPPSLTPVNTCHIAKLPLSAGKTAVAQQHYIVHGKILLHTLPPLTNWQCLQVCLPLASPKLASHVLQLFPSFSSAAVH